jgi:hypothetical protein
LNNERRTDFEYFHVNLPGGTDCRDFKTAKGWKGLKK